MKKKGISPLIATVLIIGFTVALAAIIITWSTAFTKKMQSTTEQTANTQVLCATDVVFSIKSVCATADSYKVLIQNDGKEPINNWIVRFYQSDDKVRATDTRDPSININGTDYSIGAFGIQQLTFSGTSLPKDPATGVSYAGLVKKVEAIPVIRSNPPIVCSQNVGSYGDSSSGGTAMTSTTNPCTS